MADPDPAQVESSVLEKINDVAQDLFNIEVNIILRDNITAQKMPNPRHALLDIGKEYCAALEEMERWRQQHLGTTGEKAYEFEAMRQAYGFYTQDECADHGITDPQNYERLVSAKIGDELGGFDAFDVIRNWAASMLEDWNNVSYLSPAQIAALPRIKDNADLLKGMYSSICRRDPKLNTPDANGKTLKEELDSMPEGAMNPNTVVKLSKKRNPSRTIALTNEYTRSDLVNRDDIIPLPLRESELVLIRKVWELGVEVIAMQTIVQVDGDVITRLNPIYLDDAQFPTMREYHHKAVEIAIAHWSKLIDVAKELIVATAEGISGRIR